MRHLILCGLATALLALTMPAHAQAPADPAAAPAATAPAATPATAPAATPSTDKPAAAANTKSKKGSKRQARNQPTKAEMTKVRQHVPAEYHKYLPAGR